MSRHRIEPPLGLRSSPNLVVCTKRKAELLEEFLKRLDYVLASFRLGLATVDFNESLTHLKRTVRMGPQKPGRGDRLHPILEILVNTGPLFAHSGRNLGLASLRCQSKLVKKPPAIPTKWQKVVVFSEGSHGPLLKEFT